MTREELLKKIRNNELIVLICAPGTKPHNLVTWEVLATRCALCQGDIHMDAANREAAKDYVKICVACFITSGLMADAPPITKTKSMVGGQEMSFEEGMKTVVAMVRPTPKGEES